MTLRLPDDPRDYQQFLQDLLRSNDELRQQVTLAHPFRDYLRRFYYDYLIYYPEAFQFLVTMVGTDRIVVGTDIFAAQDVQYPTEVLDQFKLPAADRERILKGNAKRLLGL